MAYSDEIEGILRAVTEFMDYVSPAEWRSLVQKALVNEDIEGVLSPDRPFSEDPRVRDYMQEYCEWKQIMAAVTIPDGSAFRRDFWLNLVKSSETAGKLFPGMDPEFLELFGKSHARWLMGEVLSLARRSEFSEAERLNDAGFERHFRGGYEDALRLHNQAISVAPDFALAWINKGIALKNLGRVDEAIQCYDWVIERLDPQYKKAWHNKGVALMTKGALQDAVKCFDRALEIDPGYEIAIRVRKKCLDKMQTDKLITTKIQPPQNPQALQIAIAAREFESRGNWNAAARMYEQALTYEPSNSILLACLGEALFECGRHEEAEARLLEALKSDKENGMAWLNLTRCYLERKDFQGALKASDQAIRYSPDFSMCWANRAAAQCFLERYREAEKSARRSIELDSYNAIGRYYLGISLLKLRRYAEAREQFEFIVRVLPNFHGVQVVREILKSSDFR